MLQTNFGESNFASVDEYLSSVNQELDQARRSLKEITLMIDQSQAELNKISQKNAAISATLQQIQSQLETMPRSDIKAAYSSALDAQQRLLVMRGQLEKLQAEQAGLKKYILVLEKTHKLLSDRAASAPSSRTGKSEQASLEMLINAQESERQRLSRQMHDGPAQALSNFIVQTEIVSRLFDIDPARAKDELASLKTSAAKTFQKVRGFISELRPMMLDDLGLLPTVRRYADMFKEQTGIEVALTVKGTERRLQPFVEVFIFRAIQELIGNAVSHNLDMPGKVQVNLQLIIDEHQVKVTVSDNGKGFDPSSALHGESQLGLNMIKERVAMLGGTFDIDTALGKGCRITFMVPNTEIVR
jgi:two-component system, NarL family, sensor histidine kinase DegS